MKGARTAFAVLVLAAAPGCAPTMLRSGLPPGDPPPEYAERWHADFLFGTIEASGPYELSEICPQGWSEVIVEPDAFTTLAGAVTLFLYSPSRVTVVCAAKGASGLAPLAGHDLPEATRSAGVPR